LVEKLQAISTKFRHQQETGDFPPNFMRHYHDVASLLQDAAVQAFVGTPEYAAHKKRRFPAADNPVIAENEAFLLSDPATQERLRQAYAASAALYYEGQPPFEALLKTIGTWASKL
jgi:hypothetical protein